MGDKKLMSRYEHKHDGKRYVHPCRLPQFRKAWDEFRKQHLARNPLCAMCSNVGNQLDHIIPLRYADEIDLETLLDESNLQILCASCHSRKTAEENRVASRINKSSPYFCTHGYPIQDGVPMCGIDDCKEMEETA